MIGWREFAVPSAPAAFCVCGIRLLGRPVSESGRLRHGSLGAHARADRRWRGL